VNQIPYLPIYQELTMSPIRKTGPPQGAAPTKYNIIYSRIKNMRDLAQVLIGVCFHDENVGAGPRACPQGL